MSPKEKRTVAYHESGHALVAELVPGADPVAKISIIPRGIAALGYTQQTPTEDRYLLTQSELMARVYVLLGGRVAEEMIFGDVSTGAQNDLQRATEIARTMVTQFGMSREIGLVALEGPRQPLLLPIPMQSLREYSEDTARLIDNEVKRILTDAHRNVTGILLAHRPALEELAQLLLHKEVVERPELQTILKVVSIEKAKEQKRFSSGSPEDKTHEA
jgi:cell division protease FtsH